MKNKLSICIPTWNRRERLISQLKSLYSQQRIKEVSIFICDNNSDYDVYDAIEKEFGKEKINNLKVHRNKFNIGGNANIATLFLHCETDWMWILGDDDKTSENAIDVVLNNIDKYPEVTMFKYSLEYFHPHEDIEVYTLSDFFNYYKSGYHTSGDMIFLSNNVYRMAEMGKFYGMTLEHCYCKIPHILPIMNALEKQEGTVRFCSSPIVTFLPAESGKSWNYLRTSLGISTVSHMCYDMSDRDFRLLATLPIRDFCHKKIINSCKSIPSWYQKKAIYSMIYHGSFIYSRKISDKFLYCLFMIYCFSRIDIFSIISRIKSLLKCK